MVLAGGVLGGVVVHILVVLAFPNLAGRNLWNALAEYGPPSAFAQVPAPAPGDEEIAYLDPTMLHAVCRIDLASGPHRVTSNISATYWSLGVLDRRGRGLYGVNGSTAGGASIDLLLISSADLEAVRREPPALLEELIIVEVPTGTRAIAVLRAFVRDTTMRAVVAEELGRAECVGPIDITDAPPAAEAEVLPDTPADPGL